MKQSKNWKVVMGRSVDRSSYFEMDTREEYLVVNKVTGKVFMTFTRSDYANANGERSSGIDSLDFSEDGKTLIATYVGGSVEKFDLPE